MYLNEIRIVKTLCAISSFFTSVISTRVESVRHRCSQRSSLQLWIRSSPLRLFGCCLYLAINVFLRLLHFSGNIVCERWPSSRDIRSTSPPAIRTSSIYTSSSPVLSCSFCTYWESVKDIRCLAFTFTLRLEEVSFEFGSNWRFRNSCLGPKSWVLSSLRDGLQSTWVARILCSLSGLFCSMK